jgi:hypothetical protein
MRRDGGDAAVLDADIARRAVAIRKAGPPQQQIEIH